MTNGNEKLQGLSKFLHASPAASCLATPVGTGQGFFSIPDVPHV